MLQAAIGAAAFNLGASKDTQAEPAELKLSNEATSLLASVHPSLEISDGVPVSCVACMLQQSLWQFLIEDNFPAVA